jgi:hypothetical protein
MDGEQTGVDLGCDVGFLAEMGQVCGEAVAQVDGSGRLAVTDKPRALGDARLRVKVGG